MRRWPVWGGLLVVVMLGWASLSCQEERASQSAVNKGKSIAGYAQLIFLGDSLTAGYGLPKSQALPALVQSRLSRAGLQYRVVNAGRSGDTTAGGLSRLDWYFEAPGRIAAIVVGLGSNDAMRGLSVAEMEQNLRKIIVRVRDARPRAKIFLWELKTFPNLGAHYRQEFAAVFPRIAEQTNAILIPFPLREVAGKARWNQADGIHPNRLGTEKVADAVWSVLREHLPG